MLLRYIHVVVFEHLLHVGSEILPGARSNKKSVQRFNNNDIDFKNEYVMGKKKSTRENVKESERYCAAIESIRWKKRAYER